MCKARYATPSHPVFRSLSFAFELFLPIFPTRTIFSTLSLLVFHYFHTACRLAVEPTYSYSRSLLSSSRYTIPPSNNRSSSFSMPCQRPKTSKSPPKNGVIWAGASESLIDSLSQTFTSFTRLHLPHSQNQNSLFLFLFLLLSSPLCSAWLSIHIPTSLL